MLIFPAIDLKDGKPVRLTQGDFATAEQVAQNALETARDFEQQGATHLHMVDLDGAKSGAPIHAALIKEVAQKTKLFVQVGGGIRTRETILDYLENGVSRVILGSAAIKDRSFTESALAEFGEKIAIGIDAKDGLAMGGGWTDASETNYIELAREMEKAGAKTLIYTDISKDGTLAGPNLEQLAELTRAVDIDIIASGGIKTLADLEALAKLGCAGAICGKSLYKGTLTLAEALALQSIAHPSYL